MSKTILDDLDRIREEVESIIDVDEVATLRFALVHCVKALRYAKDADGLSPTRRQLAKSAWRMGSAALGVEESVA